MRYPSVPRNISSLVLSGLILTGLHAQGTDAIRLNQIGFYLSGPKTAIVRDAGSTPFMVITAGTQDTVFRGVLAPVQEWSYSSEYVSRADFSDLKAAGRYVLVVQGIGRSNPFDIATRVHQAVGTAALKGFYYQRASLRLTVEFASIWARQLGHPDTAVRVHPSAAGPLRPANSFIAAPRGWYDAGDFNKYVVNSGISTYTLLALYEHHPEYCARLNVHIPESTNGIPDVLDEVLWNLRWMLSMQDPADGGVYTKLTAPEFDGWIMPSQSTQERYVVMKSTGAALDFASVMAQAARVFRDFPDALPGLADSCLQASFDAWNWARQHPAVFYNQALMNTQYSPAINTGEYGDDTFLDEFQWAAAELSITTAVDSFLTVASPLSISPARVPTWQDVGTLGLISMAHHRASIGAFVDSNAVKSRLLALAGTLRTAANNSAYRVSMGASPGDFVWGSNSVAANQGMILLMAFRLTGDSTYLSAAVSNLDYLLGRNATTYCFVTGFGSLSPIRPHHRISGADNIPPPVPGLLVGGPNPGQQDGVTTYPSSLPALSYTDNADSYASNEIAINWNAPLAYLALSLESLMSPDGAPTSVSIGRSQLQTPEESEHLWNYPNPFNPSTTIRFQVPTRSHVQVEVFNLVGQRIEVLCDGELTAGEQSVAWRAPEASGIYLCRLTLVPTDARMRGRVASRKMLLIR